MGYIYYEATQKQLDYIAILFLDCGFTLAQRKDFLKLRFEIEKSDELNKDQASKVISELKELKEQTK